MKVKAEEAAAAHSKVQQKCSEEESKLTEISNIPVVNATSDMSTREAFKTLKSQMTTQRSERDGEIFYEIGAAWSGKPDETVKIVVKKYPVGGKSEVLVHIREYYYNKKEKIEKPTK